MFAWHKNDAYMRFHVSIILAFIQSTVRFSLSLHATISVISIFDFSYWKCQNETEKYERTYSACLLHLSAVLFPSFQNNYVSYRNVTMYTVNIWNATVGPHRMFLVAHSSFLSLSSDGFFIWFVQHFTPAITFSFWKVQINSFDTSQELFWCLLIFICVCLSENWWNTIECIGFKNQKNMHQQIRTPIIPGTMFALLLYS